MAENWIVALTNFPVVFPLITCLKRGDVLTAGVIAFVGLASFLSHLVENHKHGMPGAFGGRVSEKTSYYLNRLDVVGCMLTLCRFAGLYYFKDGISLIPPLKMIDIWYLVLAFVLLRVSEYDKYNPKLKGLYVATHSLWHISIFLLMNDFIQTYL